MLKIRNSRVNEKKNKTRSDKTQKRNDYNDGDDNELKAANTYNKTKK